jgi:threonine/homoserine/homoserine lactone efflux protein
MEQFLLVATAHFLALLSPGPDFFLVARTSASAGWRVASGACLGIALANGVFIGAAFAGVAVLHAGSALFVALQLAGCAYLLYIGACSCACRAHSLAPAATASGPNGQGWLGSLGMGFTSGILNPKNALFYASLASMIGTSSVVLKGLYAAGCSRRCWPGTCWWHWLLAIVGYCAALPKPCPGWNGPRG